MYFTKSEISVSLVYQRLWKALRVHVSPLTRPKSEMGGSKAGFIFGRVCFSVKNGGGDGGFRKCFGSQPKRTEPAFRIYGRDRISSFTGIRSVVVLLRIQQKSAKRAKQKV